MTERTPEQIIAEASYRRAAGTYAPNAPPWAKAKPEARQALIVEAVDAIKALAEAGYRIVRPDDIADRVAALRDEYRLRVKNAYQYMHPTAVERAMEAAHALNRAISLLDAAPKAGE